MWIPAYLRCTQCSILLRLIDICFLLFTVISVISASTLSNHVLPGRFCCLPTPLTLATGGGSILPDCGPPVSFSIHLASSAVTLAGSVHKSRGVYVGAGEDML